MLIGSSQCLIRVRMRLAVMPAPFLPHNTPNSLTFLLFTKMIHPKLLSLFAGVMLTYEPTGANVGDSNSHFILNHTDSQKKMFKQHRPLSWFKIKGSWICARNRKTAMKIRNNQIKSLTK